MIGFNSWSTFAVGTAIVGVLAAAGSPAVAEGERGGEHCAAILPDDGDLYTALRNALRSFVLNRELNGGIGNNMWASIVDPTGRVCAVVFSGDSPFGDQWLASRVISAQKAHAAVSLSLQPGISQSLDVFSTANLWGPTQPGGSLWELPHSNPVNPAVAYGDNRGDAGQGADTPEVPDYGSREDPLVGEFVGGINVFGGGLALYDSSGDLVGGLGASGDTSCADHNIAWRVRHELGLDFLTSAGVRGVSDPPFQDNIIYDPEAAFGHPTCGLGEEEVELPPTQ